MQLAPVIAARMSTGIPTGHALLHSAQPAQAGPARSIRSGAKYTSYHPYAIKGDTQFAGDLAQVAQTITGTKTNVHTGDLTLAHTQLETIRPVFQGIFKRNDSSIR